MCGSSQKFIGLLSSSPLRRNKFLYFCAILLTPLTILNVIPIPHNPLSIASQMIYFIVVLIVTVTALLRLTPHFNKILRFSGGMILPGRRVGKVTANALLVFFFVWVTGWFDVITNWIDPQVLGSETLKSGIGMAFMSLITGPVEETWRWAFILSLFYTGVRIFGKSHQLLTLWICVLISCVLFGVGHIGQMEGHDFATWIVLSLMGLSLFLFAYWGRSVWTAIFTHIAYDFLLSLGIIQPYQWSWWPLFSILWLTLGFLYFKWRKSAKLNPGMEEIVRCPQ